MQSIAHELTRNRQLLRHVVPSVLARHPAVAVDLVAEDRLVDIVAEGFDAGVRLGEAVPQDMVGVRFGGDIRFLAVAAPSYLERAGTPTAPDDLRRHACIRQRLPSGKPYRWEFERHGQAMVVDVPGALTLNHSELMADAAADGLGIAYIHAWAARPHLQAGRLTAVLDDWSPPLPGLHLYYPSRRQPPSALRAFVDVLKEVEP